MKKFLVNFIIGQSTTMEVVAPSRKHVSDALDALEELSGVREQSIDAGSTIEEVPSLIVDPSFASFIMDDGSIREGEDISEEELDRMLQEPMQANEQQKWQIMEDEWSKLKAATADEYGYVPKCKFTDAFMETKQADKEKMAKWTSEETNGIN